MKKLCSLFSIAMFSFVFSQTGNVGINTSSPHVSAVLDVSSDSKGFLLPRLTTTAITALSATASEGLVVFDSNKKLFLGWDGTKWQILGNTIMNATISLAAWEVTGYPAFGNSPVVSSSSNAAITSATLERASGVTTSGSGSANVWGGTGWVSTNSLDAIAANQFAIITLNFAPGNTVSFTKINPNNFRRSATGATNSQYQYSINNGTTYTNIGGLISLTDSSGAGNNISDRDLTLIYDLQNINTTIITNVKFRIISYGATSLSGNWYINNISGNDLDFIGTVN